ncbi:MAG: DNA primase small subunit domain-containing protein, partial [Candidatus Pacearchaeota archaeon]|nr:DNA primase small subunit domain-containing protein [Candidatus Pacearchaeota archaeon]
EEKQPGEYHPSVADFKEERIRKITNLYYSRKDIQKALFSFSSGREIAPSYMMESFGKRPDSFQYPGDVFELAKKGATSFHCSEELWTDPLKVSTGMNEKQLNEMRHGWDFLLDIDSKYLDYSKIMAELIIKVLKFHGVKNFGIKFSGSKGFHIIVPSKAFPQTIHNNKTSDMFPEWPRILTKYIMEMVKKELIEKITRLMEKTGSNKYVKDFQASEQVMPDLILVSPRHLFRMPYSLHEKTALASVVLKPEEIHGFQPKDADPFKAEIRNFMPDAKEGEASELLREALDWHKMQHSEETENSEKTNREFKPILLKEFSETNFPPSIKQILQGMKGDGRKRALFIIMNFFRSIGMERKDVEALLADWNKKNELPLKEGYIKSQLISSYRGKPIPPPNYDKDYYKGIGIVPTEEELRYKNPANYMVKKT